MRLIRLAVVLTLDLLLTPIGYPLWRLNSWGL